jgi:hypothetical protein
MLIEKHEKDNTSTGSVHRILARITGHTRQLSPELATIDRVLKALWRAWRRPRRRFCSPSPIARKVGPCSKGSPIVKSPNPGKSQAGRRPSPGRT